VSECQGKTKRNNEIETEGGSYGSERRRGRGTEQAGQQAEPLTCVSLLQVTERKHICLGDLFYMIIESSRYYIHIYMRVLPAYIGRGKERARPSACISSEPESDRR